MMQQLLHTITKLQETYVSKKLFSLQQGLDLMACIHQWSIYS